ncbi:unnamed protein product [Prunus armeniaca]|uniref:Uncharacterized protein n=1 Tax=Prunus armeniaca TaxID=36596 RepID=A0A6J5TT43_PRUAR|nr:unnamed protein product [Prunus armeniaca]
MADLSKKFDSNSQRSQISCSIFLVSKESPSTIC